MGLPTQLMSLLKPQAYPHGVAAVQLIETHISWVLLTGEYAYKIKRPVHYAFIDMRSAERRAFLCAEEVRLNRRFAPEIYLGVCEVTQSEGDARIGGSGEVIEHAVRMRQFRSEDELDRLLEANRVEPQELETFGRHLAAIHRHLPVAEESQASGTTQAVRAVLLENIEQCAQIALSLGTQPDIQALRGPYAEQLKRAEPWIAARRRQGRVRECHGDLHSRNVVRAGTHLIAFDCMEFEPAFRWIDVAEEVAFLLMDLGARDFPLHGQAFLRGYLTQSGDYEACRLLALYGAHRALVRAKVSGLVAEGASTADARVVTIKQHRSYLAYAQRLLTGKPALLLLMAGLSGSGKTWLAQRLAPALSAVHIRSDIERKRVAGLSEHAKSGSGLQEGLYSSQMSERVCEHLAQCAEHVLSGGYTVIVDATFNRRDHRMRFRDLATRLGVAAIVIHCHAPSSVLRARVTERHRSRADASEADESVLEWQQAHVEPVDTQEHLGVIDADTTRDDIVSQVRSRIAAESLTRSALQ